MTPLHALVSSRLVVDLRAILKRGDVASRLMVALRDRMHRFERELAAADEGAEALLLMHFRICHDCVTGPGCHEAREIAEYAVARTAA